MLQIQRESAPDDLSSYDYIPPGALASLGSHTDSYDTLLIAGCFTHDTGGEIRTANREAFESLPTECALPVSIMELTHFLCKIELGQQIKVEKRYESGETGIVIIRHIPTLWN